MNTLQFTSLRLHIGAYANLILGTLSTNPWCAILFGGLAVLLFSADYFATKLIQKGQQS